MLTGEQSAERRILSASRKFRKSEATSRSWRRRRRRRRGGGGGAEEKIMRIEEEEHLSEELLEGIPGEGVPGDRVRDRREDPVELAEHRAPVPELPG